MSTLLLRAEGITKSFFGVRVLHGIGYELARGEALGLVGENGSGKSTTMNILGGVLPPDSGAMWVDGERYAPKNPHDATAARIAFVHQELNLFGNLSIEENLFIDAFPVHGRMAPLIDRRAIRQRTEALLAEVDLKLSPRLPVARLSQGEKQLLELAKALSRNARIVILDEPTTSLTRREIDRLFAILRRLKARGIGLVFVSHVLADVVTLCERISVLRDGALVGSAPVAELPVPRIISMMVGRAIDTIYPPRTTSPQADTVLSVRGLSQPGVAENVSLEVRAGEVVGLAGLMGSGRSELARMIFGLDPFARGQVEIGGRVLAPPTPARAMAAGMAFLTEDRRAEGLVMDASIAENLVLASLRRFARGMGLLDRRRMAQEAASVGRTVHLSTTKLDTTAAKHLSGGNQQKVVFGKWLMRAPKLFILDEPTRGIDVGARQEVYRIINGLVERGGAVLLISSEIEELMGLSDRILTIARGALTGAFVGPDFDREAIMAAATPAGVSVTA